MNQIKIQINNINSNYNNLGAEYSRKFELFTNLWFFWLCLLSNSGHFDLLLFIIWNLLYSLLITLLTFWQFLTLGWTSKEATDVAITCCSTTRSTWKHRKITLITQFLNILFLFLFHFDNLIWLVIWDYYCIILILPSQLTFLKLNISCPFQIGDVNSFVILFICGF